MTRTVASPDELRALSARLVSDGVWLLTALDRALSTSGGDVWRGNAAIRFAAEADQQRRRLRAVSDDLRLTSRSCLIFSLAAIPVVAGTSADGAVSAHQGSARLI
jgi:hypothetical protein